MVNIKTTIQTSTNKPISSTSSSTIKTSKPITSTMSTQPRCFTGKYDRYIFSFLNI